MEPKMSAIVQIKKLMEQVSPDATFLKTEDGRQFYEKLLQILTEDDHKESTNEMQVDTEPGKEAEENQRTRLLLNQIMWNDLISQKIMDHLPVSDLIRCTSLISHHWHLLSRRTLTLHRQCFLMFKSCRKLPDLLLLLLKCPVIPFNGLYIDSYYCSLQCISNHFPLVACSNSPPSSSHASFLDILGHNIKYVHFNRLNLNCDCVITQILQKLFKSDLYSSNIFEITISRSKDIFPYIYPSKYSRPFENDDDNESDSISYPPLSNLRKLNLSRMPMTHAPSIEFVKRLLRLAPKYLKINGTLTPSLVQVLLEKEGVGDLSHLTNIVTDFSLTPKMEDIEFCQVLTMAAAGNFKLRKIVVHGQFLVPWLTMKESLKNLLEKMRESLTSLFLDHVHLVTFIDGVEVPSIMPILPHVAKLRLRADGLCGIDTENHFLNKIDFFKKFPKCQKIRVYCRKPGWTSGLVSKVNVELRNEWERSLDSFEWDGIIELDLKETLTIKLVRIIVKLCPNVKRLVVTGLEEVRTILPHFWGSWEGLEEMELKEIEDKNVWENMDSVFTGIRKEDCNKLRMESFGEEMNENIAGMGEAADLKVASGITDLKKLTKFRMEIKHSRLECIAEAESTKTVFLSHVTGKFGFGRMPNLKVTIVRHCCEKNGRKCHLSLDHLTPWLNVEQGF